MTLTEHLQSNWLDYEIIEEDLLFKIKDIGTFLVIKPKDYNQCKEIFGNISSNGEIRFEGKILFDTSFNIILDDLESNLADNVDFFCFQFGGKWYHYQIDQEPELKPLKYLGQAKVD